ncbi:5-oxoprolinase [bacterium (Candidatus Blackallbacteria) CG17_big_fil_post_rev_8_21_14_2_50_48_46]|uniref:5-oxoprolinase n=1 Tax=bacterium (Candidatus Blackallbacteria) CG17_big_fil_post_rev_8_21_14_2_50_48_46 TaxID=2014261 RepID=A0A2M7G5Y8_9BACT|nr:MAG: 5-oxoprolinase [bacterium (Candidatus Blackallbacteria) CG18_big_fil_WC_8_21_14_2_50_49_26]PIW17467.1 MAG: 5-oxoprolinase [bacterium (Candidatus Blackallbacteria) CG17_big_fil_post_rev_8_21_14_2_50_48_46]PIW48321.1 MAG: 5-oxoprolinase [bacterium (Candidatus Blackallbacteria) CG13_big_fil_rev_8_21_14_2_50_49_14]
MKTDPIQLEIYKHRFRAIAEEMGAALCRSAYSSNIKERRDFSCAIFDAQGQLLAQAEHLPVHLGSMPLSVQAAIQALQFEPGDSVLLNDPFAGGTHLPDITMVEGVFLPGEPKPRFYVANRAHHADVGGMTPGSMPLSREIFQEGLRIPPLKWRKKAQIDSDLLALILNNVRTPLEREGDLLAQNAANQIAIERLKTLCLSQSTEQVASMGKALQAYASRMMRAVIAKIPDGVYAFQDALEDDGYQQEPLWIKLQLEIRGEQALVDFSGTSAQTRGCINTILAVTLSSVFYVFRCLLDNEVPSNSGCLEPIQVIAPEGSLVNACFPSAVVGGNVETSQRLVDVLLGALAQALPDKIPAASQGTMNNLSLGGIYQGQPFAYYETIGGGMGASPFGAGASAIHSHMTNTLNTPIEALELSYPLRVRRYALREGSGGIGLFPGGEGLIREMEILSDCELTLLTERRKLQPYGLQGGSSGAKGKNSLQRGPQEIELPGKVQISLQSGDRLRIETPGGGGWGLKPE